MNSTFSIEPRGPFQLELQCRHFGGWPTSPGDPQAPVMAFPLEDGDSAGAVVMRQEPGGDVIGQVHAGGEAAWQQALATVSLDEDGSGWPEVGHADPLLGELQERYGPLRPTTFHSPYEAACAFIIGHRISIRQTRAIRARIAEQRGSAIEIGGRRFHAFPAPAQLLAADTLPGVPAAKHERLHAVARAAQEGWLNRGRLRALPAQEALARLQELPGIGPFFAQGILLRGAGARDAIAPDDITRHAVRLRYACDDIDAVAERWRPYRMWAVVLLHVWVRSEGLAPSRTSRSFARVKNR